MKRLLLTTIFVLFHSLASATLTPIGNTVFDDMTGLKWLRVTETQGQSVSQAETNFPAFRHATKLEVCSLVDYFYTGCNENTGNVSAESLNTSTLLYVVSLLGATYPPEAIFGYTDGNNGATFGCITTVCALGFPTGLQDSGSSLYGHFMVSTELALDTDSDGIYDAVDNCVNVQNQDQRDTDSNGVGDACNSFEDLDGDERANALDNCPNDPNDQTDTDGDSLGDACDPFPSDPDNELAQCLSELAGQVDLCPDSQGEVDQNGCSLSQFCARQDVSTSMGRHTCRKLDWKNDEPTMRGGERDCNYYKVAGSYTCLPQQ